MAKALALTNERRDQIIKAALEQTFTAREAALKDLNNTLATLAYEYLYPYDIRTKMATLPDEFFAQTSVIYVKVKHDNGCTEHKTLNLTSSRKISARDHEWRRPLYTPPENSGVAARIGKLWAEEKAIAADREALKKELQTFLAGITTMRKLQEVWPEGQPYYQSLLTGEPRNLPAVLPDTVNAMLLKMR